MVTKKSAYEDVFNYPEYHSAIQTRDWETALRLNKVLTVRALVDWSKETGEVKMMREEQAKALRASAKNLQGRVNKNYISLN